MTSDIEKKQKSIHTLLTCVFFLNLVIFAAILLIFLFLKGDVFKSIDNGNVIYERYAIIITLALVPVALKLFQKLSLKYSVLPSDEYLCKYTWIYILRMLLIDIAIAINIVGFYIFDSKNLAYLTVVPLFALAFCFPSKRIPLKDTLEEKIDNNTSIDKD